MKKILFLSLALILFLTLIVSVGCATGDSTTKPIHYVPSRWVSKTPPGEFVVNKGEKYPTVTFMFGEKEKSFALDVYDFISARAILYELNSEPNHNYSADYDDLISCSAKFKPEKFTINVIYDPEGVFDGYKKITFYRDFEYENKK